MGEHAASMSLVDAILAQRGAPPELRGQLAGGYLEVLAVPGLRQRLLDYLYVADLQALRGLDATWAGYVAEVYRGKDRGHKKVRIVRTQAGLETALDDPSYHTIHLEPSPTPLTLNLTRDPTNSSDIHAYDTTSLTVTDGYVNAHNHVTVTGVSGGEVTADDQATVTGVSGGEVTAFDQVTVTGVSGGEVTAFDQVTVTGVSGGKVDAEDQATVTLTGKKEEYAVVDGQVLHGGVAIVRGLNGGSLSDTVTVSAVDGQIWPEVN